MNNYANIIMDNRFTKFGMTADDMGPETWAQYRSLCDIVARAAWDSVSKKDYDENILGVAVAGLVAFFDADFKATPAIQRRVLAACIRTKTVRSDAMKAAYKDRTAVNKALANYEESFESCANDGETLDEYKDRLTTAVNEAEAKIITLRAESGNEYYERADRLDRSKIHATAECRKLIEDVFADIMTERTFMSAEELAAEAAALKAERKTRKAAKKAAKKAAE